MVLCIQWGLLGQLYLWDQLALWDQWALLDLLGRLGQWDLLDQ